MDKFRFSPDIPFPISSSHLDRQLVNISGLFFSISDDY